MKRRTAAAETPTEPEEEPTPSLIFQWGKVERRWPSLLKWLLATILGLVGFSYLFKVAYPQYQVPISAPHQVTVLNTADPSTVPLLHKIADKDFLIIPDSQPPGELRLDDHVPVFHPSYEKHEFRLEDLPHPPFTVPPARLLDPSAPVLPPPDLSQLKRPEAVATASGKPVLSVVFAGPLVQRKITHLPSFSTLQLADPEAWQFHIGVDAHGRVSFALPIATGQPASRLQEIVALFEEMRFQPDAPTETPPDNASIIWDNASFQWSKPPSP